MIGETTNSVFNEGRTAAQVQADLAAYVLHRRSATCLEAPGGQLYAEGPRIHPLGAARDAIAQAIRDTLEAL